MLLPCICGGNGKGMSNSAKTKKPSKRGRGRPPLPDEEKPVILHVRFPRRLVRTLDAALAKRRDGADRSSLVRELVVLGCEARGYQT
jgi:hypothetical protein